MRLINLFCLIILFSSHIFSQIANSGFEDWTTDPDNNNNPIGWQTTNSYPIMNVEPYTPACEGNFAMKVKTVEIGFGFTLPGVAFIETAYNFVQAPTKLSACVKSNIVSGDIAFIMVALMKGDSVVAAIDSCTFKIDSSISQFTYHEFPLALQSNLVPDSIIIFVMSGLINGHVGTELIIDEISFSGGISSSADLGDKNLPGNFVLNQNYPNPFNPGTTISYSIPENDYVQIVVYDIIGNEMAILVNEEQPAGNYKIEFNGYSNEVRNLPSGVYFYRLRAGDFIETKKMILLK